MHNATKETELTKRSNAVLTRLILLEVVSDSTDNPASVDEQIVYHKEMEQIAMRASDFIKAEHHRKLQEILWAIKEKQKQSYKTPEQISDEDYKVAPTSADKDATQG